MFRRRSARVGLMILATLGTVALCLAIIGYYTWGAVLH